MCVQIALSISCSNREQPMQVCKSGVARLRKIWLTRHGESEYNEAALIGGNSNLTPSGQIYARLLPDVIVDRVPLVRPPATCICSVGLGKSQCHAQALIFLEGRVPRACVSNADAGGRDDAGVCVDQHAQEDHPDRRAAALPEVAVEGALRLLTYPLAPTLTHMAA